MESDGLLQLMKELYDEYKNQIFYETIVTDDDTKIKKYLTYPFYASRGWVNKGGCLPLHMVEPAWFADPTHRAKCVSGVFFEMTKGPQSKTRANKLDALRMKKYYSYFVKKNRSKDLQWLVKHAMAPLDHLFGNHHLCSPS